MTTEEAPKRKKPAVRKSTAVSETSTAPRPRKAVAKKSVVKKVSDDTQSATWPDWIHPEMKMNASQLLAELNKKED